MSLKELRQAKGFSQSQLATAADMSIRTLQHYEQGSRDINNAGLHTLIKLSEVLECKVIDILDNPDLIEKIKSTEFK